MQNHKEDIFSDDEERDREESHLLLGGIKLENLDEAISPRSCCCIKLKRETTYSNVIAVFVAPIISYIASRYL